MFPLIRTWTSGSTNNRDASDLRRHHALNYVTAIWKVSSPLFEVDLWRRVFKHISLTTFLTPLFIIRYMMAMTTIYYTGHFPYSGTEIARFWQDFHRKLMKPVTKIVSEHVSPMCLLAHLWSEMTLELPGQPVTKNSSKWRHFRLSALWQYFTHPYLEPSFVSSGNNFHLPIYFRTGSLTYYLMKRVHEYVDLYLSPRAIQFLVNIPT